jgi:hypothetical protein
VKHPTEGEAQVHTISSSLPAQRSSASYSPKMDKEKAAQIVLMLSRLAVHFYRPDFTEGQAKSMIQDMVSDLGGLDLRDLDRAIATYRQTPFPMGKFKPFPDSGTLIQLSNVERKHRTDIEDKQPVKAQFGDSRPIRWWSLPPYLWQPHWQESEIPAAEHALWAERLKRKRASGDPHWQQENFAGLARKHQQAG